MDDITVNEKLTAVLSDSHDKLLIGSLGYRIHVLIISCWIFDTPAPLTPGDALVTSSVFSSFSLFFPFFFPSFFLFLLFLGFSPLDYPLCIVVLLDWPFFGPFFSFYFWTTFTFYVCNHYVSTCFYMWIFICPLCTQFHSLVSFLFVYCFAIL